MSILVHHNTKVLVQGITGKQGRFHTEEMIAYGTRVVGGVTPGKGGTECLGVPVFDTVREAKEATGADTTVLRSISVRLPTAATSASCFLPPPMRRIQRRCVSCGWDMDEDSRDLFFLLYGLRKKCIPTASNISSSNSGCRRRLTYTLTT